MRPGTASVDPNRRLARRARPDRRRRHRAGVHGRCGRIAVTTGPAFSTAQSWTVSAWVRLDSKTADWSVLDQRGANTSLFDLRYAQASDRWTVKLAQTDVATPTYVSVTSTTAPRVGTWTHLTVVYDAGLRQARLYVDGRPEGTAANVNTWTATGNFRLATQFAGGLADVNAWQRTLLDSEIRAIGEVFGTGEGAHAAGDFDPQFRHTDGALCRVVVERDGGVGDEAQVVIPAILESQEQGVVFALEFGGPCGGGFGAEDHGRAQ
jgi:hypothetical protein